VRLTAADRKDLRVDLKTDSDQSLYEVEVAGGRSVPPLILELPIKSQEWFLRCAQPKTWRFQRFYRICHALINVASTRQKHGAQHKNLKRPYQTHSLKILRAKIKL
jgi:hypothetical protein